MVGAKSSKKSSAVHSSSSKGIEGHAMLVQLVFSFEGASVYLAINSVPLYGGC
jgi:hypothetical protein